MSARIHLSYLLQDRIAEMDAMITKLRGIEKHHASLRPGVLADVTRAWEELATVLLPALTREGLAHARDLTGYEYLVAVDHTGARERERTALAERLAWIDAEPQYRDRELLRAPNTGSLTLQIREHTEYRAPLADVVARCNHPRFGQLLATGYDTDAYTGRPWRLSYYNDWEAGDAILERFPGKKRFREVRAEYETAVPALAEHDRRRGELMIEWNAGVALEKERDDTAYRLANLDATHLKAARDMIVAYLRQSDLSAVGPWLAREPTVELMAKRAFGLERKLAYLDGLATGSAGGLARELENQRTKLIGKVSRCSGSTSWKPVTDAEMTKASVSRADQWNKRVDRWGSAYSQVLAFDTWDTGALARDFLWWDVMTDGRLDGDFLPEIASHHSTFPRRAGAHDDDPELHAAAAVAGAYTSASSLYGDIS